MLKIQTYLTQRGHGWPKLADFGEVEYKALPVIREVVTINEKVCEVVRAPAYDHTLLPPPVTFNGQAPDPVVPEVYVVER